jgi:hypothetical protein
MEVVISLFRPLFTKRHYFSHDYFWGTALSRVEVSFAVLLDTIASLWAHLPDVPPDDVCFFFSPRATYSSTLEEEAARSVETSANTHCATWHQIQKREP